MTMLDYDDRSNFRTVRNWALGTVAALLLLGGAATVVSNVFNLAWMPWQVQMQTHIIRNSNSYITTQQVALRQLYSDSRGSITDAQRIAIIAQMRQIADLIPGNVPPDIALYLTQEQ